MPLIVFCHNGKVATLSCPISLAQGGGVLQMKPAAPSRGLAMRAAAAPMGQALATLVRVVSGSLQGAPSAVTSAMAMEAGLETMVVVNTIAVVISARTQRTTTQSTALQIVVPRQDPQRTFTSIIRGERQA